MSKKPSQPDPRLLVSHLADGSFYGACELVRSDPAAAALSLRSLLLDPVWKYIEVTKPGSEGRDAALRLVEVVQDVMRNVDAGRPDRAIWLADKMQSAWEEFERVCSAPLLWQELPGRLRQKKDAAKASAEARKADPVSKQARIVQAARRVRLTHEEKSVAGIVARQVGASVQYVRRVLKSAADQEKGT